MRNGPALLSLAPRAGRDPPFPPGHPRYKQAVARPGALTAMINYYRASIRSATWQPDRAYRALKNGFPMPVLALAADQDGALSTDLWKGVDKLGPDVTFQLISNCSHWVSTSAAPSWGWDLRFVSGWLGAIRTHHVIPSPFAGPAGPAPGGEPAHPRVPRRQEAALDRLGTANQPATAKDRVARSG